MRAILDPIAGEALTYLIGGSRATYPISDCDVTIVNRKPGAPAHEVVGEFYRRFRERYGVEPETMFDANVFANFPELTAGWVPWSDPRLRAVFDDPRFTARRNAIQLSGSFARVARDLGPFRFHLAARELRASTFRDIAGSFGTMFEIDAALRRLDPLLDRAEAIGVRTRDEILHRWRMLSVDRPCADQVDLWRRAGNELFTARLAEAAPTLKRWESLLARTLDGPPDPKVRSELEAATLELDRRCMEASLFKVNDYATRGAMKDVLKDDEILRLGSPSRPSVEDLLASLIEQYAAVWKGLLPYLDEPFPVASIRASKYAVRFWSAAADLARAIGEHGLERWAIAAREHTSRLRERNKGAERLPPGLQLDQAAWLRRSFRGPIALEMIRGATALLIARAAASGLVRVEGAR
jgi:hypothetical protein